MADVVVSAEFVRPGLVGGTEQALHYVLDGLSAALGRNDRLTVIGHVAVDAHPGLSLLEPPRPARPRFVQETLSFRRCAPDADAYFFPNYFTPPWPSKATRVVTTIPDLQYLHLPDNFSRRKRAWLRLAHEHTLRRASVVTVYSEFVRSDIRRHYRAAAGREIEVLPIPISWDRFTSPTESSPERPYVLSVASHYAHKNLATLVRAFRRLVHRSPDLELVLVGQLSDRLIGVRRAHDVRALIAELGLDDRVRVTGFVDVAELGQLYRHAAAFAFPSVFEGFGLPPVEALGFGLPVVTTRCASLPEVTLGLAEYVDDPHDDAELADRLAAMVSSGARTPGSDIARVREHYAPARIGRQLYDLMTSGS